MQKKAFLLIVFLVVITAVSMVVASKMNATPAMVITPKISTKGAVSGNARLIQSQVLKGGDGSVTLAVSLNAQEAAASMAGSFRRPVDLIVVLDRSGSMQGEKLDHAKMALEQLIRQLSHRDRFALVTYADSSSVVKGLTPMIPDNRHHMIADIRALMAGGGTNLSAGMSSGINLMPPSESDLAVRHMLVVSDGLANQGITEPSLLGQMVARASDKQICVDTVGVGHDFNEYLMTLLADQGQGRYYYLENPLAFAGLFTETYLGLNQIAASDLRLKIQLLSDTQLTDAGGYPIHQDSDRAFVKLGNILFGESRSIFLTFKVATHQVGPLKLGPMALLYQQTGEPYEYPFDSRFGLTCVDDPNSVYASYEKDIWTQNVLQNDYSRLKREVAKDLTSGNRTDALQRIDLYRGRQAEMNRFIGSERIAENLDQEVESLRKQVRETFQGAPEQVMLKQKRAAKRLHYDGYKEQRSLK